MWHNITVKPAQPLILKSRVSSSPSISSTSPSPSTGASPGLIFTEMVGRNNGWTDLSEEAMDSQNREYQERLSQKTAFLKSLAVDIESEAKDHHRLLDGVGDDFDGSSGLLTNSLGRVNKMLGGGKTNRQIMLYIIIFVVAVFVVLYYVIGRLRS